MASSQGSGRCEASAAPRHAIERAGVGYCLEGAGFFVWEPSFQEVAGWRDELEASTAHYRGFTPRGGSRSQPFPGILYGPLSTRRLGRSLGVNLSPPGRPVCNFRCVYCEFRKGGAGAKGRWPTPREVSAALARVLSDMGPLDSITISGHGEPTLHPRFGAVVDSVLRQARRLRPEVPVRALTNGTGAIRPEVRRGLDALDERIVKLDAAPEQINRPARSQHLGAVLQALSLLHDVSAQSCFVEGVVSNTGDSSINEWMELLAEIRPRRVQVYTIDHRPSADEVYPVPVSHLEGIAQRLRNRTGLETLAYY